MIVEPVDLKNKNVLHLGTTKMMRYVYLRSELIEVTDNTMTKAEEPKTPADEENPSR